MFLTQAMVLVSSIATAALVASIVGPPLFHGQLVQSGRRLGAAELPHIERAFTDAGVASPAIGFLVALVLALLVSWYDHKRLRRPLEQLTVAASQVSTGDYAVRVPKADFSSELDSVGKAFNDMAYRLDATEETRRRGGSLAATSPGEKLGASFTLMLPLVARTAPATSSPARSAAQQSPDALSRWRTGILDQRHGVDA